MVVGGDDEQINNAAVQKFSQVYEDAQETLETNYFGAKTVTKELFPLLRSTSPAGARIVMVSSKNGLLRVGNPVLHLHVTLVAAVFADFEAVADFRLLQFFSLCWS
jgi:NAD(P)-dependent dehydrogenase (short-subunit alcohol dehydrogenase family)